MGNEGLRHAHNYTLKLSQPGTYTESTRLRYQDPCRIAFLGDSIFLTGLDPQVIPDSYNFAWLDANYLNDFFTLRWMLRANPKRLEAIVLPLDRHSFAARRLAGPMVFSKATLFDAVRADFHDRQRGRFLRLYVRDHLFPYADLPKFWSDLSDRTRPSFRQGFLAMETESPLDAAGFARSAEKRGRQMFRGEAPYDNRLVSHLDAIIEAASAHGLKVLLVQSPVTREFDKVLRPAISDDAFDDIKQTILEQHPNVEILDVRDRFLDRHDLFNDANHLNSGGAREFSRLVRDKLQAMDLVAQ